MCLSPITIVNPTKYVSVRYRDRYLLQVPCGKCAQCMTNKSNEWHFRLYNHSLDVFAKGGFVSYMTLTYNRVSLPHISEYIDVPKRLDFPCFRSEDIRLFVTRLRQHLKRKFNSNLEYFIVSEYGTSEKHTHRPHYHALFFVYGDITPLEFSRLVSQDWYCGRTDGLPYSSRQYVMRNTFIKNDEHSMRAIKYITKYIQKSCKFQAQIDKRIGSILSFVSQKFKSQGIEDWSNSSHYWRLRDVLHCRFDQFHRQSTFLGASALQSIDINDVFRTGSLYMPDDKVVVKRISLPKYYKRKLFYQLCVVDGAKTWQPTELGRQYLSARLHKVLESTKERFSCLGFTLHKSFDFSALADYVLNKRGRFFGKEESTLEQRLNSLTHYNYITRYDYECFGKRGLSGRWLGNSSTKYYRMFAQFLSIKDFIKKYVFLDSNLENQLETLYSCSSQIDSAKQKYYERLQELKNLHHYLSS